MALCQPAGPADFRRLFWATQASCATSVDECGNECGVPGLNLVDACDAPCGPSTCPDQPKTIDTSNYIRGVALNILLTDAPREIDGKCGFRPGLRGGHWSQSFAPRGYVIGSRLRKMKIDPRSSRGFTDEAVATAVAFARADLAKMTKMGLCTKIDVQGRWQSGIYLDIKLYGDGDNPTLLGLAGARSKSAWIWAAQGIT